MNDKIANRYPPDKHMLHTVMGIVSACKFCEGISENRADSVLIACTKYAGSMIPICVNIATCLSCVEYEKLSGIAVSSAAPGSLCDPPF